MPSKFRSKSTKRRKTAGKGKRKSVPRGQRAVAPRTLPFMLQPRRFTKMFWEATFNIAAGGSVGANTYTNIFRINSIYDPDFATASTLTKGTSVNGYSLGAMLYNSYRVHAIAVTASVQNMSSYNTMAILSFTNNNSFPTAILPTDMAARNGATARELQPLGTDKARGTMSRYVKIHNVTGQTHVQYTADINTSASMGGNPTGPAYVAVTFGPLPDANVVPVTAMVRLKLIFYVELYDIKEELAQAS